jgi:hypothetical protein
MKNEEEWEQGGREGMGEGGEGGGGEGGVQSPSPVTASY